VNTCPRATSFVICINCFFESTSLVQSFFQFYHSRESRCKEFKFVAVTTVKAIFDFSSVRKEGASKRASIFNVTIF
jgi:hypothetical protein